MKKKITIGYLTTRYPSVSHTFIRREIMEVERTGYTVQRYALRPAKAKLVDPLDLDEAKKTVYCLKQPIYIHVLSFLFVLMSRPIKLLKIVLLSLKMYLHSERNLFIHIAYILEACTLFFLMKKMRVQHIHVHFGTNVATIARLISKISKISYSFTVHGPAEFDSPVGIDLRGKIKDSKFTVAISDYCSAQLKRWSDYDGWEKIKTVRCTVGHDFFKRKAELQKNNKTFVCVGRLCPQKGNLLLIDSFNKIVAKDRDAKLIFVGDGEMREKVEKEIENKKLGNNVIITGFVSESEVRKYISNSIALVLPSFAEGLPMVIMEAFALGRPVISTYVAGIPELVINDYNGWLIPAGSITKLTTVMEEVLTTSIERLSEMAENGRSLTKINHSTDSQIAILCSLFKELKLNEFGKV